VENRRSREKKTDMLRSIGKQYGELLLMLRLFLNMLKRTLNS